METYKVLNDEITRLREEKAALLAACKKALSTLGSELSLTEKEKGLFPSTAKEVEEISDTIKQLQSAIKAGEDV